MQKCKQNGKANYTTLKLLEKQCQNTIVVPHFGRCKILRIRGEKNTAWTILAFFFFILAETTVMKINFWSCWTKCGKERT